MTGTDELLELAQRAAAEAAHYLLAGWSERRVVNTKSSGTDVVTQMDQGAETMLVEHILAARPGDGILGEEGGSRSGDSDVVWVIDPLDGTVNYLYGLPVWAVSVGVQVQGRAVCGVVHAPALNTVWRGIDDGQESWAEADGSPIRVTGTADLGQALIGTGFGYRREVRAAQAAVLQTVLPEVRDVRRAGSAAIDMCWVAQGVLDGYYERGTHAWDRGAATAVARGAGAVVGGLGDRPAGQDMVVVSGPALWDPLQELLRRGLEGVGSDGS